MGGSVTTGALGLQMIAKMVKRGRKMTLPVQQTKLRSALVLLVITFALSRAKYVSDLLNPISLIQICWINLMSAAFFRKFQIQLPLQAVQQQQSVQQQHQ